MDKSSMHLFKPSKSKIPGDGSFQWFLNYMGRLNLAIKQLWTTFKQRNSNNVHMEASSHSSCAIGGQIGRSFGFVYILHGLLLQPLWGLGGPLESLGVPCGDRWHSQIIQKISTTKNVYTLRNSKLFMIYSYWFFSRFSTGSGSKGNPG